MKFFLNLYGMSDKILFVKFSSKMVLKVSKVKFVEKNLKKILEIFWEVLERFEDIVFRLCTKFAKM